MDLANLFLYAFGILYTFSTGIAILRAKDAYGKEVSTLTIIVMLFLIFGYWWSVITVTGGQVI